MAQLPIKKATTLYETISLAKKEFSHYTYTRFLTTIHTYTQIHYWLNNIH